MSHRYCMSRVIVKLHPNRGAWVFTSKYVILYDTKIYYAVHYWDSKYLNMFVCVGAFTVALDALDILKMITHRRYCHSWFTSLYYVQVPYHCVALPPSLRAFFYPPLEDVKSSLIFIICINLFCALGLLGWSNNWSSCCPISWSGQEGRRSCDYHLRRTTADYYRWGMRGLIYSVVSYLNKYLCMRCEIKNHITWNKQF